MKKIPLLFFLLVIMTKSHGQNSHRPIDTRGIDSVSIEYVSLCENIIDVIKVTADSITFYSEKELRSRGNHHNRFYQIKKGREIELYFDELRVILDTDPVYGEDSSLIVECMPYMIFTFYLKDCVVKKIYDYHSHTMFPCAYTALHYRIFTILNKKDRRSNPWAQYE